MMYEYPYESNPVDTEIFLSREPLNLTKAHIRSQFKNPGENKVDYVGSFIETYTQSQTMAETDDDIEDLDELSAEFVTFMTNLFVKYLGLGFPELDNMNREDQMDILHMTYRYFIINIKHNFSSFCLNYIERHRAELVERLPRRKDVTTINLKKEMVNPDDVVLISNMYDVITDIIKKDHDIDEFLVNSDWNEPRLETELMNEYFEGFTVVGEFYSNYKEMVTNDLMKDIESKIRNKILKEHHKKPKSELQAEYMDIEDEDD